MGKKKKPKTRQRTPGYSLPRYWSYCLLAVVLLFFGFVRMRLLAFPLERDEGEYAYAGQLILQGIAPYTSCYTMKLPGTAAAYALIMAIFGQTPSGIHFGLLLVSSATSILVYFLAEHLFGELAGVAAGASFALLSIGSSVFGFAAHATQFVVLPAVGGILLLLKAIDSQRLAPFLASGLSLGLAFLMKQPGILFAVFSFLYLAHRQWKNRLDWRRRASQLGALFAGVMLPLATTCLILWKAGVLQKFWFWTFSYAREYEAERTFSDGLQSLWQSGLFVVGPAMLLWLVAAAGLVAILWNQKLQIHVVFLTGFLVFSFAAVCPGLYFRPHYFVLLLPAVSLLCGVAVDSATKWLLASHTKGAWTLAPVIVFAIAFGGSVVSQREFFFEEGPVAACRRIYRANPFPEALKISEFLKTNSADGERIAVIGSEPEIYFYSGRHSATGYIYMYPLMEAQPYASTMQKEMISEIEESRPRFVVLVNSPSSWLRRDDSDTTIFSWAERYVRRDYQLVGAVDMLEDATEYHWNDAGTYQPRSSNTIFVFKRSGTGSSLPVPSGNQSF